MMEMILVKLITLAGPPSVGKTFVILRLIEVLHKEKQKAGVIKFDCLTTFDKEPYEKANIPIQIGLSGKFCPDHFFISNIEEAVAWGKSQNLDYLIVIVITKGDIISQAEREVFMYNVYQANPKAQVIFINGITGQGAFMLKKYINKIEDIDTLEGKKLRFTSPAAVCSYCTDEMRIGEKYQLGMTKKMEFN